jgi:hypothetical protein
MHVSVVLDSRTTFVHLILALQSDPGLMAMISIAAIGTLAKFVPVIVTGIPGSPGGTDCASVLTVESCGGGVEREVHVDASEQEMQVAFWNMALQSNVDSQPLVGSLSLSNFPSLQIREEQTKSAEHDVHVALATDVHEAQLAAPLMPNVPEEQSAHVPAAVVDAPVKRVVELTTWLPHAV